MLKSHLLHGERRNINTFLCLSRFLPDLYKWNPSTFCSILTLSSLIKVLHWPLLPIKAWSLQLRKRTPSKTLERASIGSPTSPQQRYDEREGGQDKRERESERNDAMHFYVLLSVKPLINQWSLAWRVSIGRRHKRTIVWKDLIRQDAWVSHFQVL